MTFASDAFTNTDGTVLSTHDANWVKSTGWGTPSDIEIRSNAATCKVISGDPGVWVYSSASSADYEVSAVVKQLGTSTSYNAGVLARFSSTQATGYMARYRYNTGVQLFVFNNSTTATQLGSTVAGNLSNGGTMTLKLVCDGDQISVYKDGSLVIGPITNTVVSAANRPGIWNFGLSSDGCSLDNWDATYLSAPSSSIASISNFYRMMRSA